MTFGNGLTLMMTCETVKPLLPEWTDETLDAGLAWQVQTHLADCDACGRIGRELRSLRLALSVLPTRGPSADFDAKLAQRLALTRRPAAPVPPAGRRWLAPFLGRPRPFLGRPRPFLRPALALGFAVAVLAAVPFTFLPERVPQPPAASRGVDQAFVADCVAQHRREAAGEPLGDPAAQNLLGHLDSGTGEQAPPSSSDSLSAADSGLL